MPTLITGAGLVGTLAAARLIREGRDHPILYDVAFAAHVLKDWVNLEKVRLATGDVTDLPDLIQTIRDHGVDRIIHTAALHTSDVRKRPFAGARINFMGTMAVLEAARLTGIKRVVFCSSSTIYLGLKGAPPDGILFEDFSPRVVSEYPPSVYASLKLASEWVAHHYRNEHGVDFAAVRLAGVFGPWSGALSSPNRLIKQLVESAWLKRPCQLTTGEMAGGADYVYCHDAAQGVVRAAFSDNPSSRVYNIGMGRLYSVEEIIDIIEKVIGRTVELRVVEGGHLSGYGNNPGVLDISRARTELGYEVEYPMDEAIKDFSERLIRDLGRSS
jgi:nucleoside-diphosphate-sugar epimerase